MRCIVASICEACTQHVLAPPLTEVLRYSAVNAAGAIEIRDGIMFVSYLGLPHVCAILYAAPCTCAVSGGFWVPAYHVIMALGHVSGPCRHDLIDRKTAAFSLATLLHSMYMSPALNGSSHMHHPPYSLQLAKDIWRTTVPPATATPTWCRSPW